ncbi:hypothetical protein J6590_078869 [Homalodisca vitripennis]|nr:hypothetical protein J6590_078869 [Homalodisca vitripennis]
MFFSVLDVAIINSYLLYKDVQSAAGNRKAMNHFAFRKCLVRSLMQERCARRPRANRKRARPVQVRDFYDRSAAILRRLTDLERFGMKLPVTSHSLEEMSYFTFHFTLDLAPID